MCLDRPLYRREVERAVDARIVTVLEGRALLAAADLIHECEDEVIGTFHQALLLVASSTTPSRARHLALWTPFDPEAVRRLAKGACLEGRP